MAWVPTDAEELKALLAKAVAQVKAMTPEQREAMFDAQKKSAIKGMRERHAAGDFEDASVVVFRPEAKEG